MNQNPFSIWTRHLPICTQKRARMYDAGNCSAVYLFKKKEPYFSSLVAYCDNQFGIASVVGLDSRAYHIDNPFFDEKTGIAGKNPYLQK